MRSSRPREQSSKPKALLALKLSGSSFLDTVIRDDKTKDPIYILETVRELTHVYRLDYHRDEPVKAATIQWPIHPVRVKGKTGRSIQFGNGSWREAEELLKTGPLGSNAIRKFNIPHYPNSLKWKLIPGNCFCCVTNAVKGPVAVLDAATLSAPPRLKNLPPPHRARARALAGQLQRHTPPSFWARSGLALTDSPADEANNRQP
ncbi:hypothetical protein NUW54_g9556 [Trametes sanguinea]|uniref:Uncharacterized protein n=1 Tax=Trametes sanguinea TaxID=158606 RepID=A0ACC1P524_9APHY|nr:hypothetical protein NUW54_g9556 [Trametes sanguinea]